MTGAVAVVLRNDGFALQRHLVDRSVSEINHLLGMAQSEAGVRAVSLVPGVGVRRCVVSREPIYHVSIPDLSRPRAVAHRLELAIPPSPWQPDLEFDVRVFGRLDRRGDAAKSGQLIVCGYRC